MLRNKKLLRMFSLILTLTLMLSLGSVTAFARTAEEEAAIKRIENALNNLNPSSTTSSSSSNGKTTTAPATESIDLLEYAKESIVLTNKERTKAGLEELVIDEEMMELAAIRAKELAEKFSHERPDGTRVSKEYYYAEIISGRSTPTRAVEGWMKSTKGHKEIILSERYQSIGAGCYQADDGIVYWAQLFSK